MITTWLDSGIRDCGGNDLIEWRNFIVIHDCIIRNFGDDEFGDTVPTPLTLLDIAELLAILESVNEENAPKVLPANKYDALYYNQIREAIPALKAIIDEGEEGLYYWSWA